MRWTKTWMLVFVMFVVGSCCESKPAGEDPVESGEKVAGDSSEAELEGDIMAVVNGIPISREDFLRHTEHYPARMKENLKGREHLLKVLVDQILLDCEAKRLGVDSDPEFQRRVDIYRRNLLNNMLFDKVSGGRIDVTEQEAKEYFDNHPEKFDQEFEEVRHNLSSRLRARKRKEAKTKLIDSLRGKAQIELNRQALESIQLPTIER